MQAHVLGQQRLQPGEVALVDRREETLREPIGLLARGLEPRPALVDLAPSAADQLPRRRLALADDLGDAVVGVVEDLAQQERRPLLGRQALEQDEEPDRERVGELGMGGGVVVAVGDQRRGQPLVDR
jgi:hypothetical protein